MSGGREALIVAAVRLFQARGYHGVSTADILSEAGLPKGSLYHHFPGGKEALAVAATIFIADEVDLRLQALFSQSVDPQAVLQTVAKATAGWLKAHNFAQGALSGALAAGLGPDTPLLQAAIQQAQARWIDRFVQDGGVAPEQAAAALAWLEGAILMARTARNVAVLMAAPPVFRAQAEA